MQDVEGEECLDVFVVGAPGFGGMCRLPAWLASPAGCGASRRQWPDTDQLAIPAGTAPCF